MEELDENQRQAILRKRQEMLKKMGVQKGGQMMNESVVSTNGANNSMAAKLAAIRNGSAKSELDKHIHASSKGSGTANSGFQLPEPKKRNNPNHVKEEVKPEYKQELKSFDTPSNNSHELNAIDAMFGGDSPTRIPMGNGGSNMIAQNPVNMKLDIDSTVLPSFNPQAVLQQKMRERTQEKNPNSFLKYASDTPQTQNEEFVDATNAIAHPQVNLAMMQTMMETIAKGIAEKTIRNVLNEYSQQQKGKVFFEYYNKEKGIIKTSDGKYYRLTQVELRKK